MLAQLKPKKYTVRYPKWMVGKPLLYASSALASLGDALFGYSQGAIAAAQVQPSFIGRMYHVNVSLAEIEAGKIGVAPFTQCTSSLPYLLPSHSSQFI